MLYPILNSTSINKWWGVCVEQRILNSVAHAIDYASRATDW